MYYDTRNREKINLLAPHTREKALSLYNFAVSEGIEILIVETLRSEKLQREYVNKGLSRTMKSYHLVGQAFDFVPTKNEKTFWDGYGSEGIQKFIAKGKQLGFEWGGNWKGFVDKPHMQYEYLGRGSDKMENKGTTSEKRENGSFVSVTDYLNSINVDSSFANRKKLAIKYGIANYTGTAEQNKELLKGLQTGQSAPNLNDGYKGISIVEYMKSVGSDSSFANRKKLATRYGIANYTGTTEQNVKLLRVLQAGEAVTNFKSKVVKVTSITDYLKSIGEDSSFGNRKKLAIKYGITNYTGTTEQNIKLLGILQATRK